MVTAEGRHFSPAPCCHPALTRGLHTCAPQRRLWAPPWLLPLLLSTLSTQGTQPTWRMLPWLINFLSVPLALTYLSNWLWFHFLVLPPAPSAAAPTEAFNISWLLRMRLFYMLLGSQKTSMAVISWVPAASWPKAATILSPINQMSRAEKRPTVRSNSTTEINEREKWLLKVQRDYLQVCGRGRGSGRVRPGNGMAHVQTILGQWPSRAL